MNTAIRVETHDRFQPTLTLPQLKRPKVVNLVLLMVLLMSAFTLIYIKDLNRRLFIQHQTLQATHDKLYEDWGSLLLEQSTWSRQARVQKIAEQRLEMSLPAANRVFVLKSIKFGWNEHRKDDQ